MTKSWTAYCSIIYGLSTFYPTVLPVRSQVDDEARATTADCHNAIKADHWQSFDAGMCLGIIKGLHYLSRDICIPPATSLAQIAEVVSKYVDSHTGKTQDDFRETSLEAMRSAWPCRARHDI